MKEGDRAAGPTDWPRVLVVSDVVPETGFAGSLLLYRLLLEWPADRLVVLGPRFQGFGSRLPCRYETVKHPLNRVRFSRFARWANSLEAALGVPGISLGGMQRQLGGFEPEVVLSVMQSSGWCGAAARLARARGLPFVLIVHDMPGSFDAVFPWARGAQFRRNRSIYRQAAKRLCVSPEMRDALDVKFGCSGDVLLPSPSDNTMPRAIERARRLASDGVLTVGYAGTMAYGYGHGLAALLPAFSEAGVRLHVYSRGTLPGERSAAVTYRGFLPPEEAWRRIQEECDAVILPYGWHAHGHQDLYRTHFPSKLPEYLQLGMPVILAGPPDATGVKWGLRNPDAAVVLSRNDPAEWAAALRSLRESPEMREAFARNAVAAGRRDFDPAAIRGEFISLIREVGRAGSGRRGW